MSYEFPVSVEREVERYAEEAKLSPAEAAVRLVQSGLEKARLPEGKGPLTEAEWARLRADPVLAFLWSLPDDVFDTAEAALRERRGEPDPPRG